MVWGLGWGSHPVLKPCVSTQNELVRSCSPAPVVSLKDHLLAATNRPRVSALIGSRTQSSRLQLHPNVAGTDKISGSFRKSGAIRQTPNSRARIIRIPKKRNPNL